jgi:hypothetical protein
VLNDGYGGEGIMAIHLTYHVNGFNLNHLHCGDKIQERELLQKLIGYNGKEEEGGPSFYLRKMTQFSL